MLAKRTHKTHPVRRALRWAAALVCVWSLAAGAALASHNLAGQITYKRLSTNTYEITLTTYTDPFAAGVDRCTANIEIWAISGSQTIKVDELKEIPRNNGPSTGDCDGPATAGIFARPGIKKNTYTAIYTFNGPGLFQLRYFDLARIYNVKNMSNSGGTTFFVQTVLNNNPFIGANNSPLMLNDPLDDACLFRAWTHNPGAYDPDGDSLSFHLIPNRQYQPPSFPQPVDVANYQFPDAFGGSFTIDATTGLVTWDAAEQVGVYNICIQIKEWRNGAQIGEVVRDMAIFVKPCINNPPDILTITDTCVKPGERLVIPVTVTDPDVNDSVYFYLNNGQTGNNGPFSVPISPATFSSNLGLPMVAIPAPVGVFIGELVWDVECVHIRPAFYQVDYYVHDDVIHGASPPFEVTLSDNHIIKIKVRPNPVRNLVLTPGSRQIQLDWDRNDCPNALGYEIYRSFGQTGFVPDSICCEGTPTDGFERIAFLQGWDSTSYLDNNNGAGLEFRDVYCYRIVTVFPGGYRSCPSEEACERIKRDFILMTNDSVAFTDPANGAVFVSWSTPDSIDQGFFPPPYTYKLFHAAGSGAFQEILTNIQFNDTTYTHGGLDTETQPHRYQVRLFDATGAEVEPAISNTPSSIFLTTAPAHESVNLSWTEAVPWLNSMYYVFQADDFNGTYVLIDSVPGTGASTHTYTARGLENGEEYCFFIRSLGSYNDTGVKDPLINDSQRTCEIPRDTVPPCIPSRDSLLAGAEADCEALVVNFSLTVPPDSCASDFGNYYLYYAPDSLGNYTLIHTFTPGNLTYTFNGVTQGSIAGCYRFTADDTLGNISLPSEPFCFDNCPVFQIVNVFTPNGDGINDFFKPIFLRSVRQVKLTIFDRWGVAVLPETVFDRPTAATPFWNGTARNGTEAPAGVYFYVLEATLDQLIPVTLQRTGSVTVLR